MRKRVLGISIINADLCIDLMVVSKSARIRSGKQMRKTDEEGASNISKETNLGNSGAEDVDLLGGVGPRRRVVGDYRACHVPYTTHPSLISFISHHHS